MQRGQGATELIALLALVAVIGLVIYTSSQSTLAESKKAFLISQARASVNDLASAASEVYSEGVGAKRRVYVVIPEGAEPTRVYVNNTIINIGVRIDSGITDVNTQTTMKLVQGSDFPTTPGSYWVTVTAKEGYVLIGNKFLDVTPSSISVEITPSNSTDKVIRFTNFGSSPFNVTLSPQWAHAGSVDISLNTTNFILPASASEDLLLAFTTYVSTPLGLYTGRIDAATNTTESAEISIAVNVVGTQLPTGVSYIVIETFKDANYSTPTTNFTLPRGVVITGSDWTPGAVTIDIKDPSGNSVSGYPTQITANSSGGFSHTWNPAGASVGQYVVTANQSSTSSVDYFEVTACQ